MDDEIAIVQCFRWEIYTLKTITVLKPVGKGVIKCKLQLPYAKFLKELHSLLLNKKQSYREGGSPLLKELWNAEAAQMVFLLLFIMKCISGRMIGSYMLSPT